MKLSERKSTISRAIRSAIQVRENDVVKCVSDGGGFLEICPSLNQILPDASCTKMMRTSLKIAHLLATERGTSGAPPIVSPPSVSRAPLPPRPRSPGPRDRVHSLLPPLNREKPPLNERTTRDGPALSRASMTWCRIGRAASF